MKRLERIFYIIMVICMIVSSIPINSIADETSPKENQIEEQVLNETDEILDSEEDIEDDELSESEEVKEEEPKEDDVLDNSDEQKEDILDLTGKDKEDSILDNIEKIFEKEETGVLIVNYEDEKGKTLSEGEFKLKNLEALETVSNEGEDDQYRFEKLKPGDYLLVQHEKSKIKKEWNLNVNKNGRIKFENIESEKLEYKKEKIEGMLTHFGLMNFKKEKKKIKKEDLEEDDEEAEREVCIFTVLKKVEKEYVDRDIESSEVIKPSGVTDEKINAEDILNWGRFEYVKEQPKIIDRDEPIFRNNMILPQGLQEKIDAKQGEYIFRTRDHEPPWPLRCYVSTEPGSANNPFYAVDRWGFCVEQGRSPQLYPLDSKTDDIIRNDGVIYGYKDAKKGTLIAPYKSNIIKNKSDMDELFAKSTGTDFPKFKLVKNKVKDTEEYYKILRNIGYIFSEVPEVEFPKNKKGEVRVNNEIKEITLGEAYKKFYRYKGEMVQEWYDSENNHHDKITDSSNGKEIYGYAFYATCMQAVHYFTDSFHHRDNELLRANLLHDILYLVSEKDSDGNFIARDIIPKNKEAEMVFYSLETKYTGQNHISVRVSKKSERIDFIKIDSETKEPLKDKEFKLQHKENDNWEDVAGRTKSDDSGRVSFIGFKKAGEYRIVEFLEGKWIPVCYFEAVNKGDFLESTNRKVLNLNTGEYESISDKGNMLIENAPLYDFNLEKVDSKDKEKYLPGAVFEISKEGKESKAVSIKENKLENFIKGKYKLTGNGLEDAQIIEIDEEGQITPAIKDGEYEIRKYFKETKEVGEDGKLKLENLEGGEYKVVEIEAPFGYEINKNPIYFVLGTKDVGNKIGIGDLKITSNTGSNKININKGEYGKLTIPYKFKGSDMKLGGIKGGDFFDVEISDAVDLDSFAYNLDLDLKVEDKVIARGIYKSEENLIHYVFEPRIKEFNEDLTVEKEYNVFSKNGNRLEITVNKNKKSVDVPITYLEAVSSSMFNLNYSNIDNVVRVEYNEGEGRYNAKVYINRYLKGGYIRSFDVIAKNGWEIYNVYNVFDYDPKNVENILPLSFDYNLENRKDCSIRNYKQNPSVYEFYIAGGPLYSHLSKGAFVIELSISREDFKEKKDKSVAVLKSDFFGMETNITTEAYIIDEGNESKDSNFTMLDNTLTVSNKGIDVDFVETLNWLQINKVDENGEYLDGAKFKLESENGYNKEFEISEKNKIIANIPNGIYTVTETKEPEGYEKDGTPKRIIFTGKDFKTEELRDITKEVSVKENIAVIAPANLNPNLNQSALIKVKFKLPENIKYGDYFSLYINDEFILHGLEEKQKIRIYGEKGVIAEGKIGEEIKDGKREIKFVTTGYVVKNDLKKEKILPYTSFNIFVDKNKVRESGMKKLEVILGNEVVVSKEININYKTSFNVETGEFKETAQSGIGITEIDPENNKFYATIYVNRFMKDPENPNRRYSRLSINKPITILNQYKYWFKYAGNKNNIESRLPETFDYKYLNENNEVKSPIEVLKEKPIITNEDGKTIIDFDISLRECAGMIEIVGDYKPDKIGNLDLQLSYEMATNKELTENKITMDKWVKIERPYTQFGFNEEASVINFENKQKYKLIVHKIDKEKNVLEGAEFKLKDYKGNCIEGVTDENGIWNIGELNPGEYTLIETKAPIGYKLLEKEKKINVSAKKKIKGESLEERLTFEAAPIGVVNKEDPNGINNGKNKINPFAGDYLKANYKFSVKETSPKLKAGDYFTLKLSDNVEPVGVTNQKVFKIFQDNKCISTGEYYKETNTIKYIFNKNVKSFNGNGEIPLNLYVNREQLDPRGDKGDMTVHTTMAGETSKRIVKLNYPAYIEDIDDGWPLDMGSSLVDINYDEGTYTVAVYMNRKARNNIVNYSYLKISNIKDLKNLTAYRFNKNECERFMPTNYEIDIDSMKDHKYDISDVIVSESNSGNNWDDYEEDSKKILTKKRPDMLNGHGMVFLIEKEFKKSVKIEDNIDFYWNLDPNHKDGKKNIGNDIIIAPSINDKESVEDDINIEIEQNTINVYIKNEPIDIEIPTTGIYKKIPFIGLGVLFIVTAEIFRRKKTK